MKCYHCKSEIDNDSLYCDQCGERIYICPKCGIAGKGEGKRCGQCGTQLVAAGSDIRQTQTQSQPQNRQSQAQYRAQTQTVTAPTRLVCRSEGIALVLTDGAMIGRVEGPYAAQLAHLKFISARHATLKKDGLRWIIADVGSRNGTAVNGQWCYSPLPFGKGDTVRIANAYDFIAE